MASKKILKIGEEQILPITKMDCVVCEEGKLLNEVLEAMKADIGGGEGSALKNYMTATDGRLDALEGTVGDASKGLVKDVADLKAKDENLEGRVAANEAFVKAQPAIDSAQDAKILALENANKEGGAVANAIKAAADAADAAQQAADKAQGEVDTLEGVVGNAEGGLIKRVNELEADHGELRSEFAAEDLKLQNAIDAINNAENGLLVQAAADAKAKDDALKAALQKEIDDAEAAFAAADTALKTELQAEIDADVKVEKERAEGVEAAIRGEFAAADTALGGRIDGVQGEVDAVEQALADEKNADKEGSLANKIAAEVTRATGAENGLDGRITALEGKVGEQGVDAAIEAAVNKAVEDLEAEDERIAGLANAAQQAADKAQGEVDAVEKRLDDEGGLVDRLEAVEDFKQNHDHSVMEQGIADNLAAINVLNGGADVEGSVAKAVKAEETRAKGVESGFETRIAANEAFVAAQPAKDKAQNDRLAVIEGNGDGSVKKALADAKAYADELVADVNTAAGNLEDRVEANEAKFVGLKKATVQAAIDEAEAAAKADAAGALAAAKAAQEDIDAFMAAADTGEAAVDTLKEIQKYITDDGAAAQALVARVGANETAIGVLNGGAEVAGSVAKAVADEAKLRKDADDALAGRVSAVESFVAAHTHDQLQAAIDAINNAETGILKQAKDYADEKDAAIQAAKDAADAAQDDADANAEAIAAINNETTGILAQAKAYAKEQADGKDAAIKAAQDAADAAQGEIDALEVVVGDDSKGLMGRVKVLENVDAANRISALETAAATHITAEDFTGNLADL